MKKLINYIAFFATILFLPITSYAFKIDTHVWVGQQVINDLEADRKLTFNLGNRSVDIEIDSAITDAILANKSAFLMGNIGPDASPDVIVGQTVVHPGVEDENYNNIGWRTNQWLEYLLEASQGSEIGTAYTYGYLGHAAADVFAHTYVNQYAGDIFRLTDDETLVEQRHFVLENFIGGLTPRLKNYQNQNLGNPWDVVNLNNDELATFIRDNLIYNEEVQAEYSKVDTTKHLTAYYEYRKAIDDLAEDNVWNEIDVVITQIIVYYFTEQSLSDDEAQEIVDAGQSILDELGRGSEDIQQFTNDIYDTLADLDEEAFSKLLETRDRMRAEEQRWINKRREWRERLLDVQNLPDCSNATLTPFGYYSDGELSARWGGFFDPLDIIDDDDPLDPLDLIPDDSPEQQACEAVLDTINAANEQILSDVAELEDEALGIRYDLEQTVVDLRNETVATINSLHTIQNAIVDLAQLVTSDVSPIQAILRGWRSDVDIALTEYVKATGQSMINTMNPDSNVGPFDPIVEWFNCYHYSIIGVPSAISSCEVQDSIQQLTESLGNVNSILGEAATLGIDIPDLTELQQLVDEEIDQLKNKLIEEVTEELISLLPQEVQDFLEVLDLNVNDEILNDYFTRPEILSSPKGLLMIPDMASRVRAEMNITAEGTFDPEEYSPAYNAVVMAKLALLSNYDFQELADNVGVVSFAKYLELDNVVAQAFGNIDGNHQWMPIPPPLANNIEGESINGDVDYTYSTDRSQLPGHNHFESGLGFIPWQGALRDRLFRKLFKGPLSAGVDAPELVNATEVVGRGYKYNPCSFHPFPDDINDQTCTIVPLIPVFHLLLN